MDTKTINIKEWEYLGNDGSGANYCNKQNDNILLKLNGPDILEESSFVEYCSLKYFFENGLPIPEVYDFVTDGERFGHTEQRIKGNRSFARILSEEPDKIGILATAFARYALTLHSIDADKTKAYNVSTKYRKLFGDLSFVPKDVAETVKLCLDSLDNRLTLLHGDMNPNNMISSEERNYWTGIKDLTYGDPYLDIATMYMISYCTPPRLVRRLYRTSVRRFRKFYDIFRKAYFRHGWDNPGAEQCIWNAAAIKCCALIKENPKRAFLYVPFIRGQKFRFFLRKLFSC